MLPVHHIPHCPQPNGIATRDDGPAVLFFFFLNLRVYLFNQDVWHFFSNSHMCKMLIYKIYTLSVFLKVTSFPFSKKKKLGLSEDMRPHPGLPLPPNLWEPWGGNSELSRVSWPQTGSQLPDVDLCISSFCLELVWDTKMRNYLLSHWSFLGRHTRVDMGLTTNVGSLDLTQTSLRK